MDVDDASADDIADALTAAALADDDDDDYDDDDDDDEWGEDGWASDAVSLGFAVKRDDEPCALLRNQLPSKLGGSPAWLDPVQLPLDSELRCTASGQPLRFLLQVYAPLESSTPDPRAFHRSVYLFISPRGSVLGAPGSARAFRCHLPRVNQYYADEPAGPDEPPTPLPSTLAAIARRRCARFAETPAAWAADGEEAPGPVPSAATAAVPAAPPTNAEPRYREFELVVEAEPDGDEAAGADSEQVQRLLAAYKAKAKGEEAGKDGADAAEADLEAFGAPNEEVTDFCSFTARVQRAPEQVLRYTYAEDASPLWASRRRRPAAEDIPPCERCGSRRRFEFQVMPQALHYMGIDSLDKDAPDWATLAVYTCAAACAPTPALEAADGQLCDPPDDDGASPYARAAVGHAARLSGLQSRAELNGTTAIILFWSKGRWAIECASGEKLRVRSANVALVRPAGAPPEREGGYAEEFVWVQTQGEGRSAP